MIGLQDVPQLLKHLHLRLDLKNTNPCLLVSQPSTCLQGRFYSALNNLKASLSCHKASVILEKKLKIMR